MFYMKIVFYKYISGIILPSLKLFKIFIKFIFEKQNCKYKFINNKLTKNITDFIDIKKKDYIINFTDPINLQFDNYQNIIIKSIYTI